MDFTAFEMDFDGFKRILVDLKGFSLCSWILMDFDGLDRFVLILLDFADIIRNYLFILSDI